MGLRARTSRQYFPAWTPQRTFPDRDSGPVLAGNTGWRTLSELLGVYADHPRQFSARFIPLERTTIVLSHGSEGFMENNNCTTAINNVLAEANALMGHELELVLTGKIQ